MTASATDTRPFMYLETTIARRLTIAEFRRETEAQAR